MNNFNSKKTFIKGNKNSVVTKVIAKKSNDTEQLLLIKIQHLRELLDEKQRTIDILHNIIESTFNNKYPKL
jgi:hypothetical protein